MKDRVVVITGGSRGIGLGIAERFAEMGATVALTATRQETADKVATELAEKHGATVVGYALNLSEAESVDGCTKAILEKFGKVDWLINNAGITADNLLMRMKPDDWDRVIETNLGGTYRMCRAIVPKMIRARYGRIVNISSVVGTTGNPGQANYSATKAGVEAFSRSLARELASRNITVNSVAPGFIDTDMTRALDEKQRDALLSQVPLGRLGSARDIADAVAFLVGPGAEYITGITLHVNGGMQM